MAIVPVLLIPQLIFAGALVPLDRMFLTGEILSQAMISKWALQLTGGIMELAERFRSQYSTTLGESYAGMFDNAQWVAWAVLGAFTAAMMLATIIIQKRKDVL